MTPHRCVECRKVAHLALCCLSVARMLNYMSSRSVAVRFYVIHVIYRNDECIALVPFSSPINSCHLARSVIPFEVAVLSAWPASVHINRISSCRSSHAWSGSTTAAFPAVQVYVPSMRHHSRRPIVEK